jgi:hypothetical protein
MVFGWLKCKPNVITEGIKSHYMYLLGVVCNELIP